MIGLYSFSFPSFALEWMKWRGGFGYPFDFVFLSSLDGLMMVSRSFLRLHSFLTGRRPPRSITIMHPMPPKHLCIRTKPNPSPDISQNALIRLPQLRQTPRKFDQLISPENNNVSLRLLRHSGISRPAHNQRHQHSRHRLPPEQQNYKVQRPASSDVPTVDDDVCYAAR